MPQRQFTKLWGLKKLKKIAQGLPSHVVGVAPYLVRPTDPHVREADLQGKKRLLVRTDEKGRDYRRLRWSNVPRYSVDIPTGPAERRDLSSRIRVQTGEAYHMEKYYFDANPAINPIAKYKFLRHVLHPTRPYDERLGESTITISPRLISINLPNFTHAIGVRVEGKRLFRVTSNQTFSENKRILLGRIIRFLRHALQSNQISPRPGRRFELRYSLWKDAPTTPEFYDLQEYREMQVQPKNKKKKAGKPPAK